ncbi:MAD-domain-containing protein [Testicularia cyperi]|uniref:Spindle assembly checkpoint component MAD1 n=1 Tax=Testicularia cyperi TaxID=1882483 RepID=A0A317XLN3_9BASI|nr:MAD-domain-containing protein [Testicularia cyperi]
MDGRRTSTSAAASGSGIPMRSGIPRPGSAASATGGGGAESSIPRPSSRMGTGGGGGGATNSVPPARSIGLGGPMGSYRTSGGGIVGTSRNSLGTAAIAGSSSGPVRQAPQSAAPATRTYGGLAGRISTLSSSSTSAPAGAPRAVDHGAANLLGLADEAASTSTIFDTSIGSKRSLSAAGFGGAGEDSFSSFSGAPVSGGGAGPTKRPHLRKLSMDGTSPLLLQAELPHPALAPRPESPAYEISVLRTHYDQQLLGEARKYKKLEEDFEAKCKELDRFNRQRIELLDEWEKQQEQKREKEAEWSSKRKILEDEIVRLRSLNSDLSNKNDELTTSTNTEMQAIRSKNVALESELVQIKAEAEAAKAKARNLEDEVGAQKAELDDLQNAYDDERKMRLQQSSSALANGEQGKKLEEELKRQTSHLRKLEAENAHLVAENGRLTQHTSNVELLREEKRGLESKLRVLEELRSRLAEAETRIDELKQERESWDSLLRSGIEDDVEAAFAASANAETVTAADAVAVPAPASLDRSTLPSYLSALRGTVSGLQSRVSSLSTSLEKLRSRNQTLEEEAQDVDAIKQKLHLELQTAQTQVAKASKRESLLAQELEGLKKLLQTYEAEEQNFKNAAAAASQGVDSGSVNGGAGQKTGGVYDSAHLERIGMLEREREGARHEYRNLQADNEALQKQIAERDAKMEEDDLDALRSRASTLESDRAALEAKVAALEADVSALGKELGDLGKENETLWARVGRGEFDQHRQRCLVLAVNPVFQDLDLRRKTLDALKAENAELLKRVEELSAAAASLPSTSETETSAAVAPAEGKGNGVEALVPQSVVQNLRQDISDLRVSIASKDKAMLRLKQVFSAKANEFREAIQSLFGYKVKFLENGKVKLTSTFNRSKNSTTLIFEPSETGANVGKMKLLGEAVQFPGLVNLAGLKEYWLDPDGIRQSVPCFLAALNLELYESCTMAIRRNAVENVDDEDEE